MENMEIKYIVPTIVPSSAMSFNNSALERNELFHLSEYVCFP